MTPPLWVRAALRLLLDRDDRRTITSDLSELYEARRERIGEPAARAWLRRQWAQYPHRLILGRLDRSGSRPPRPAVGASPGPLAGIGRDLHHSFRSLVRTPVLAVTITATVGLGIGATTAIFAVVDSVLLQPLPYPDSPRIVRIYTDSPPNRWPFSVVDYRALTEQQTTFADIAGYDNATITVNRGDFAERVPARFVTASYFRMLGATPLHGRLLTDADEQPGDAPAVVVSHAFWTRVLGADPGAIGSSMRLDGSAYTIVGVLPPGPGPLEVGRDLFPAARWDTPTRRGPFFITVLGRLAPNTTPIAAGDELRGINRRIYPLWSSSYSSQASWSVQPLQEYLVGDVGGTLMLVLGAAAFVLLIASNNAASLLVARSTQRSRELAVRSALGASRGRLLGHLLAENAVLALSGAAVGLAVALLGIELLKTVGADFIPRSSELGLTPKSWLFLAAATGASAVLFGVMPALQSARSDFLAVLRTTGRAATDAGGRKAVRRVLATAQFAVATPLLIGAGLLITSLAKLQSVDPGFDTENILTVGVYVPEQAYPDDADVERFWATTLERVTALPGVIAAGYTNARPPEEVPMTNNFNLIDQPTPPDGTEPAVPFIGASPEFFHVLEIPLVDGRLIDERDDGDAPPIAVVDRTWANRFYPGQSAVGRRFIEGGCTECPLTTVVGVVGDVRYTGLDNPGEGAVYWPLKWLGARSRFIVIRTGADALATLPAVRAIVRDIDPELPLFGAATMDELIADSLDTPRYLTALVAALATAALLLSVIGVYGVMSYQVQRQLRDIGIRIALGGEPARVRRMVVAQGMRVAVTGTLVGIALALALTRYLASALFEVGTTDPLTFGGVVTGIVLVALVACALPARRAAAVDPVGALREE